jgi:hypothetical protein
LVVIQCDAWRFSVLLGWSSPQVPQTIFPGIGSSVSIGLWLDELFRSIQIRLVRSKLLLFCWLLALGAAVSCSHRQAAKLSSVSPEYQLRPSVCKGYADVAKMAS